MRKKSVWMAVWFIVAGVVSAASPATGPAAGATPASTIRTDGVYYFIVASEKDEKGVPLCDAVRLYGDGTAIEADFHGKPADLAKWFHRDKDTLFPGTWKLNGDELTVSISSGFEEKSRTGKLAPEGWRITPNVLFEFSPVPFPRVQAGSSGNRRPYFTGHGDSVKHFDYDEAGNLKGIRQMLEVAAIDPDGDTLQYVWTASNGTVESDGKKATWTRPLENGRAVPGEMGIDVTDGKGGKVSSKLFLN